VKGRLGYVSSPPGYGTTTGGTERFQKLGSSKEKPVFERNKNSRIERAAGQVPEEARQEWLAMLQGLAEQIQKQQQNSQQMVQELMDTYMQLLNTPGSYLSGQAQEQQQTLQQMAQQWMEQAQSSSKPSGR
jgi:DNA-binding ferritin-like protein